jgi:hypothetical protein
MDASPDVSRTAWNRIAVHPVHGIIERYRQWSDAIMNHFNIIRRLAVAVALVTLAGCATQPPTAADRMRGHADDERARADIQSEIAEDWDNGQELVNSGNRKILDGERMVEKAQKNLRAGTALIEEGNSEVAEGGMLLRDSERRFRAAYPGLEINPDE